MLSTQQIFILGFPQTQTTSLEAEAEMELLCEDFLGRALEGRDGGQRAGRRQRGKVVTRAQPQPDPWEELGHGLHQLAPTLLPWLCASSRGLGIPDEDKDVKPLHGMRHLFFIHG